MSSELHPTRIPVRLYYATDSTHTYGRCRLARVQVTAVQQRRLPACMARAPSSFNCLGGNCDSVILYACAPARGWLQRVRQYIDTFVHWSLVAVHYLLAGHHPPRLVPLHVPWINYRRGTSCNQSGTSAAKAAHKSDHRSSHQCR